MKENKEVGTWLLGPQFPWGHKHLPCQVLTPPFYPINLKEETAAVSFKPEMEDKCNNTQKITVKRQYPSQVTK